MKLEELCFSFDGRINRSTFWGYGIVSHVSMICLTLLTALLPPEYYTVGFGLIGLVSILNSFTLTPLL